MQHLSTQSLSLTPRSHRNLTLPWASPNLPMRRQYLTFYLQYRNQRTSTARAACEII